MQLSTLKPLEGIRIVITRAKQEAQILADSLQALGATPLMLPAIEMAAPKSYRALDQAIGRLTEYEWIVFTSVQGVRFFIERLDSLKAAPQILNERKLAAIGPATAKALQQAVRKPDYVPEEFLSENIVAGLGDVNGKRILLPRADIASKRLPTLLHQAGASVDEVAVYRTIIPQELTGKSIKAALDNADYVTFTSPSTIRNLASVAGAASLVASLRNAKVACIGPVTLQAARELGIHVDVVSKTHTIHGLVEAIINEIRTV